MRGNNKRKLISEHLLAPMLEKFYAGVPVTRLIKDYELEISRPHLRKLLFIYIDILDMNLTEDYRTALRKAIFPQWVQDCSIVMKQPDRWTYIGKFPFGQWGVRIKAVPK